MGRCQGTGRFLYRSIATPELNDLTLTLGSDRVSAVPGLIGVSNELLQTHESHARSNTKRTLATHLGTHVDAPYHFHPGGTTIKVASPSSRLPSGKLPVLLGTGNPAKQRTLRWLLDGLPFSPVTPQELGLDDVPEEEGDTQEAIARAKARHWSLAGGMLAVATDGGLVLPALGRHWESRYTHRFAGPEADDVERLRRLLELMRPFHGPEREASWVEALAVADRGRVLVSWQVKGATGVVAEAAGGGPLVPGFWAFSAWYFPQVGKVYNQLSSEEREDLEDHWARLRRLAQRFFRGCFVRPEG